MALWIGLMYSEEMSFLLSFHDWLKIVAFYDVQCT